MIINLLSDDDSVGLDPIHSVNANRLDFDSCTSCNKCFELNITTRPPTGSISTILSLVLPLVSSLSASMNSLSFPPKSLSNSLSFKYNTNVYSLVFNNDNKYNKKFDNDNDDDSI